jgi:hypothetical protein
MGAPLVSVTVPVMDPVIPCPNDDNAMRTRKSSNVKDLFGVSKMAFIASPVPLSFG